MSNSNYGDFNRPHISDIGDDEVVYVTSDDFGNRVEKTKEEIIQDEIDSDEDR